jgi:hypothetical protein
VQAPGIFSAAVFAGSAQASLARAFLQSLASADAAAAFRAAGLEPVRGSLSPPPLGYPQG